MDAQGHELPDEWGTMSHGEKPYRLDNFPIRILVASPLACRRAHRWGHQWTSMVGYDHCVSVPHGAPGFRDQPAEGGGRNA